MKNVDIPTMTRKLYQDFYGGGVSSCPMVSKSMSSIRAKDLYMHAGTETAESVLANVVDKKWSVVDDKNRTFKVHDSPHNYNLQVRAHRGKDAKNDKTFTNTKNASKLAKFLLSGTRSVVLPIFNMEVDRLPEEVSNKVKSLGVSVPRGSRSSLEFTERFFKSDTLNQYLRSGIPPSERKVLAYQVLNALDNCRKAVPGFVHHNVSADNVVVYQLAPPLSGGSSSYGRPSWRTEVRLTGLEKATFDNKGAITSDLEGVASLFQGSGGNPDGTAAWLKRLVKADSYEEALQDPYFAELNDPVAFSGGASKKSKKKQDTVMGSRKAPVVTRGGDEDDSSSEESDSSTSSLSTTSLSLSSTTSTSSKKKKRRGKHRQMQQQQQYPQHHHTALFNALNGDAFMRDPSSAIVNPQNPHPSMMPFMGDVANVVPPSMAAAAAADGGFQSYMPPQQQMYDPSTMNPLAGPINPSMMMGQQIPGMQFPGMQQQAQMGHMNSMQSFQGMVPPPPQEDPMQGMIPPQGMNSMQAMNLPQGSSDPTMSPMVPDITNMYSQMQHGGTIPVQRGGAPRRHHHAHNQQDFFF